MIRRPALILLLALTLHTHPAHADVTTIGWWRLGEDDPGALAAAQAQNPTVATTGPFPLSWDSGTDGSTFYRSDTAPAKRLRLGASTLAIEIDDTLSYPGYHTATIPSSATTNIGLEIWVKANEAAVDGGDPSDTIIWNGQDNGWGYGILQQTDTWVAALRPSPSGNPLTPIATAPLTTGVWTHLALVESGGIWRFYVNGREVGSLAAVARAPESRFTIGESFSVLSKGFDGFLDEARIFSFAPGAFTVSDLNYAVLPPLVTKVKPSRISLKAGSKVTVTGENLLATTSATLGNRAVKGLQRINDTTLRFRIPKGIKPTLKKVSLNVVSEEGTATKLLKVKSEE
jgi:Concanavalin A-like lectin/glucanases superfamily/IPT/TIG domain